MLSIEQMNFNAAVLKKLMLITQLRNNRTQTKYLSYTNSTHLKYMFGMWILHGYYTQRPLTASLITMELGCSRKSTDEMVNDWVAENLLYKETGMDKDANKMYLHPCEIPLEHNAEWFEWYEEEIQPMMIEASLSLRSSKTNIADVQNSVKFNTSNTSNLRGIEHKITSVMLKSKVITGKVI